jgi:hypothetical protein
MRPTQTLQELIWQRENTVEMVLMQISYVKSVKAMFPKVTIKVKFLAKIPIIRRFIRKKLEYVVNYGWAEDFHFRVIIT